MEKPRKGRLFGRFFAASREKLQEVAEFSLVFKLTRSCESLFGAESLLDRTNSV
jgi:hypothetical protein